MNSVGLNLVDKVDYKGRKCYEVLYNRTEPCEFCTNNLISENDFYTWSHHDTRMKAKCIYQDRIIPWENKKVRLEVVSKISKSVSTRELIACGELIHDGFSISESIDFVVCQKYISNNYDDELVKYVGEDTETKKDPWGNIIRYEYTDYNLLVVLSNITGHFEC